VLVGSAAKVENGRSHASLQNLTILEEWNIFAYLNSDGRAINLGYVTKICQRKIASYEFQGSR